MKFEHIHSSSRFNRDPESLHKAFADYTHKSSLVTFTEVEFEPREKALVMPGWNKVTGDESNRNDSAVCWNEARFIGVYDEQLPIKGSVFSRMGGKKADQLYATIVVLEDGLGKSFVVGVIHLPSDVEEDLSKRRKTERTVSWYLACNQLRRRVNKLKRKFKADGSMIVADWNIDFKKAWARALVKTLFPTWKLTWTNTNVAGGTHGKRIIDATIIRGDFSVVGSAKLGRDDNSSDHRPYGEVLVL